VFGGLGQDDILGGSSDLFGLNASNLRPDGSDLIFGGSGEDLGRNGFADVSSSSHASDSDMILADNGGIYRLVRVANGASAFVTFSYDAQYNGIASTMRIIPRIASLLDYTPGGMDFAPQLAGNDIGAADEVHGESGDDFIYGQTGNDVLFGEGQDDDIIGGYGADWISGGTGADGVIGDDGRIYTSRNGLPEPLYGIAQTTQSLISTPGNMQEAIINVTDNLAKTVNLTPFNVDPATTQNPLFVPANANDIIFGGLGNDFLHGGAGDDAMSGAEALPEFYAKPFNPGDYLLWGKAAGRPTEFAAYNENDAMHKVMIDPVTRVFTAATNGVNFILNFDAAEGPFDTDASSSVHTDGDDVLFGDLGNDWLVGGSGRDNAYGGWGDDLMNMDDNLETAAGANTAPDANPSYYDRAFGGAGRDILIANTGGDRLIDWSGEFNSFLVPFSPFGASTITRAAQPGLVEFLYALSKSDGADQTLALDYASDPLRNGEPFGELGLVKQGDSAWGDQHGGPADPQPGNSNGSRDVR
jgi:Ca2+-binding RTX toxin-like protein